MLPLGGLLTAIFTGWIIKKAVLENELTWKTHHGWFRAWQFTLRFVAPIAILLILLTSFDII